MRQAPPSRLRLIRGGGPYHDTHELALFAVQKYESETRGKKSSEKKLEGGPSLYL